MNPHDDPEKNKDSDEPIYAPEEHGLGEGIGAGGGAITGAAIGSSLGPLGAVTGAVLGGVFGAIAGRGIAVAIDAKAEEAYWEVHHVDEPYYESDYAFEDYGPAYRLGWQHYSPDSSFEAEEEAMADEWAQGRGSSRLEWEKARDAAKAGWSRVSLLPKE